ncbi:macro domain-containing protein [Paenibacillus gyeongsangnamensis]|uniref:macro domain-containing protein n=1 Tax=Paenibacillus gyeongsangnamensis TaxID=3388067 RepID=UPI00390803B1
MIVVISWLIDQTQLLRIQKDWSQRKKAKLASFYRSFEFTNEIAAIKTVAFCAISTGIFGFQNRKRLTLLCRPLMNS